jgi:hypothetical protein
MFIRPANGLLAFRLLAQSTATTAVLAICAPVNWITSRYIHP